MDQIIYLFTSPPISLSSVCSIFLSLEKRGNSGRKAVQEQLHLRWSEENPRGNIIFLNPVSTHSTPAGADRPLYFWPAEILSLSNPSSQGAGVCCDSRRIIRGWGFRRGAGGTYETGKMSLTGNQGINVIRRQEEPAQLSASMTPCWDLIRI